jgi:hypothetical protein
MTSTMAEPDDGLTVVQLWLPLPRQILLQHTQGIKYKDAEGVTACLSVEVASVKSGGACPVRTALGTAECRGHQILEGH